VYQIYVDFKQAYDSIQREKFYTIMYEFGLPPKLVRPVRATMTGTETQVNVQTELTNTFEISKGLKQGDELAPMLFNLALEYVIRKLPANAKHWNIK
jgi:sorting nexin-29